MPPQGSDLPVKKQSKWSPEEDALIIELRGSGMKWEDVSKRLPGRSAISCRLHYQNYLERRSEWDEERKNKLARLYERFKSEMWAKVAEELAVPWRAAEAMHWQLGEADMARRAGVVPFSLAAVNVEGGHRAAPPRANIHFQPPDTVGRHLTPPSPRAMYARNPPVSAMSTGHIPRGENVGAPVPPPLAGAGPAQGSMTEQHGEFYYSPGPVSVGPGLAPIQHQGQPRNPGPLPSLAELTTGVSPYAQQLDRPRSGRLTPGPKHGMPMQTPPSYHRQLDAARVKRRASPETMKREGSHRRRLG
ncbi:Homeodomain-related protein, partial [Metarhizium majus ARSEF 297]